MFTGYKLLYTDRIRMISQQMRCVIQSSKCKFSRSGFDEKVI